MLRRMLAIALGALVLLALGTWIAGEQTEVAVLRTFDAAGPHDTKLWVVDVDGRAYVRIARPGREWGERLRADPRCELVRRDGAVPCQAVLVTDEPTRARVDSAFATKYGWVDWWYGVVLRSDAATVRLEPQPGR